VAALCRVAVEVGRGLFEAAGFRFQADTYRPGGEGWRAADSSTSAGGRAIGARLREQGRA
jgi:hypothetical protein